MERVSIDIERAEIYDALRADAAAHGRSVAEEVATLIEKTYAAKVASRSDDGSNWVRELIDIAKRADLVGGIGPLIPPRTAEAYEPPRL